MADIKKISEYAKRKGFIYPTSEIYGGISGFYDYGANGFSLKKNFQNLWRNYFLSINQNYVEIEANEIMHEDVFKASGHLKNFNDPVAISKKGQVERADHLIEKITGKKVEGKSCEELKKIIDDEQIKSTIDNEEIEKVEKMNLMLPVMVGNQTAYLRPETAQSPFINFNREHETLRKKMPMGLATIGRAYRNEISPRNLTIRQRAFTQAELQIFFDPDTIDQEEMYEKYQEYELQLKLVGEQNKKNLKLNKLAQKYPQKILTYLAIVQKFCLEKMKLDPIKFCLRELGQKERAFYNKFHFDLEYEMDGLGTIEIGGVHYRTDHDLKAHQEGSKQKMEVTNDYTGKKYIPHVLELSFGVDRNVYALLETGLIETEGKTKLLLPYELAPKKMAIFPLVKNKPLVRQKAIDIYTELKKISQDIIYDETGSIGRRYARQDEIGTTYCITIDFDTTEDDKVTIRKIEDESQERIPISEIKNYL